MNIISPTLCSPHDADEIIENDVPCFLHTTYILPVITKARKMRYCAEEIIMGNEWEKPEKTQQEQLKMAI